MDETYITVQGDAWDLIAYRVYGSEAYTGWLMENNSELLDVMIFGGGAVLKTPPAPEAVQAQEQLPVWRRAKPRSMEEAARPGAEKKETVSVSSGTTAVISIGAVLAVEDDGAGNVAIRTEETWIQDGQT